MSEHLAQEFHLSVSDATTNCDAASLLAKLSGLSKNQMKAAMQKGAVWHTRGQKTQRLRRAKKSLKAKDELHLYYNENVLNQTPSPALLIADEGAYSIWHKPYGMYSQGSKWGDHCTISRWAEMNLQPQRPAFVIHRLDRAASGLIIIGHERGVSASLARLFEQRELCKIYRIIVEGEFPHCDTALTIKHPVDGKAACSHARALHFQSDLRQTLVEVKIDSGRKHQIRRHMAEEGYPVVGDRLHGSGKTLNSNLQLCAYELSFKCPVSGEAKHFHTPAELTPQFKAP